MSNASLDLRNRVLAAVAGGASHREAGNGLGFTRPVGVDSPRSVPKAVVLSNAKHCPISPVGPKPGSRAARQFQANSACWR